MPPPLNAQLAELFADVVAVTPMTYDEYGAGTPGATATYPARVFGRVQMVRAPDGREVVSTVRAILNGPFAVSVRDRFTLPARFLPREPQAIAVEYQTDENGAHHVTVFF